MAGDGSDTRCARDGSHGATLVAVALLRYLTAGVLLTAAAAKLADWQAALSTVRTLGWLPQVVALPAVVAALVCAVLGLACGGAVLAVEPCWSDIFAAIPCSQVEPGYPKVVDVVSTLRCRPCDWQHPCDPDGDANYLVHVYWGDGVCFEGDDPKTTCTDLSFVDCCPNPTTELPCEYYHAQ